MCSFWGHYLPVEKDHSTYVHNRNPRIPPAIVRITDRSRWERTIVIHPVRKKIAARRNATIYLIQSKILSRFPFEDPVFRKHHPFPPPKLSDGGEGGSDGVGSSICGAISIHICDHVHATVEIQHQPQYFPFFLLFCFGRIRSNIPVHTRTATVAGNSDINTTTTS